MSDLKKKKKTTTVDKKKKKNMHQYMSWASKSLAGSLPHPKAVHSLIDGAEVLKWSCEAIWHGNKFTVNQNVHSNERENH